MKKRHAHVHLEIQRRALIELADAANLGISSKHAHSRGLCVVGDAEHIRRIGVCVYRRERSAPVAAQDDRCVSYPRNRDCDLGDQNRARPPVSRPSSCICNDIIDCNLHARSVDRLEPSRVVAKPHRRYRRESARPDGSLASLDCLLYPIRSRLIK
jgi:hypothetical protein